MHKILLAEDDATMISLLKTLLRLEGFETVALQDSDDVLTLVRNENPVVMLLDMHLTQGNGLDFLRQLRADPTISNIRVIMASGMNVYDECMAAGANVFLLKPFMPDTLIRAIREQISAATA